MHTHIQTFSPSPGEIKRREVSWTPSKELDAFAGPGKIKKREVVLDPQVSPEEIKSREVVLGLKVGLLLHLSCISAAENFLLHGQLSVLTVISVSVPPPCYRSST